MSLLGPLTTTFTPPGPCATSSLNTYVDERTVLAVGPLREQTQCFPNNYVAIRDFYYSPGICPSGYSTACSSLNSIGTITETVVTCCPSPYSCIPNAIFPEQTSYGCGSQTEASWTIETLTSLSSGRPVSVISMEHTDRNGNAGGVNAFSIQVRFQSTDFRSTTPATSTPSLPSTSSTTPPSTNSVLSVSTGSGGGLSTGTAVGIGMGSALGALLIAGLIYFLYRNSKTKRRALISAPPVAAGVGRPVYQQKVELPVYQQKVELPAQWTNSHGELPEQQRVWELPGSHLPRRD